MSEPKQPTLDIPETVAVLLDPVSGDSKSGTDAAGEEEYFRLDMEIGKVNPDYNVCIDLARKILKEKSKDLRVASWLCFAWYRSEKIQGLKNGLVFLLELLKTYGDELFPPNPVHRQKAILFLNSSRFVKLLENESVDALNSSFFLEIEPIFQNLVQESKKRFPEADMEFKEIQRVLGSHIGESKKTGSPQPRKEAVVEEKKEETRTPPEKKETKLPAVKSSDGDREHGMPGVESSKKAGEDAAVSEKSAVFSVKNILRSLFETEENRKQNKPFVFALSRAIVWGRLIPPPEENKKTAIAAPDASVQNTLRDWFAAKKWDQLISAVERNFLDEDSSFKYWLDAQKYVIVALERMGGDSADAADELKFQLAAFLKKHPRLTGLRFADESPFAGEETVKWIEEEIQVLFGDGKKNEDILPPILGEDYASINDEYRQACGELPENFEINVEKMQQGIESDTRRKGRFLRSLNLANFCIQAREYALAKVQLSTLLEKIDSYQLAQWEPALSVAVWESTYVVNSKLLQAEKDPELVSFLEKQQRQLFSKIGSYDGVLALKLANRTKRKGD